VAGTWGGWKGRGALVALALLATALGALGAPEAAARGPAAVTRLGPPPPARVRRVVTLAPSLTETVLRLGRGGLLVGVSRYDEAPEVASLPRVGGFLDPSVEGVLALKPDLLLVMPSPGNRQPVERLAQLGVPVLALPMESVEDVRAGLLAAGASLGAGEEAGAVVRDIDATRARVRQAVAGRRAPRVLFVYGFEPLVVAGPGSFAHELLADVGARNVAEDARQPYALYSLERALAARPDVVVDAADTGVGREKLQALPGLREARWVPVPSKALLHPGPALARGLEELLGLVHPGLALPAAPAPDGGTRAPDAGTPAPDAGTRAPDAGTPAADAGTPAPPARAAAPDAGRPGAGRPGAPGPAHPGRPPARGPARADGGVGR
jgi:iron complex transport system substrate-binding protein